MELAYSFRDLVHCHGWKHDAVQADLVLEKELGILHLDAKSGQPERDSWLQAARIRPSSVLGRVQASYLKACLHTDMLPPTRPHLHPQ